jgi:hypothetical protein
MAFKTQQITSPGIVSIPFKILEKNVKKILFLAAGKNFFVVWLLLVTPGISSDETKLVFQPKEDRRISSAKRFITTGWRFSKKWKKPYIACASCVRFDALSRSRSKTAR